MPISAAGSVIDIAMWFARQAQEDGQYLQPQKMQRLLYMAQGGFGALYHGRKLCPATFVADENGPLEPNIYRLFEYGMPELPYERLTPEVTRFLSRVWNKYGHHSTDFLNQQILSHKAYKDALKEGEGAEIPFSQIVKMFKRQKNPAEKTVKTADGRMLQKWVPATAKTLPSVTPEV